jgi:hypothetical protein
MRQRASRQGTAARLGRHSGRESWLIKSSPASASASRHAAHIAP